jgi:Ca-activated chloride channel family protein
MENFCSKWWSGDWWAINENIAKETDGKYFRATSNNKLAEIYASINKLETTEIEELKFYDYDENLDRLYGLLDFLVLLEVALRIQF